MKDRIVEEIRQARDARAKQFNYDLDAICYDLRKREKDSRHADSLAASQTSGDQKEGPTRVCLTPCRLPRERIGIFHTMERR